MKIMRVLGFALAIITLKFLVPRIFHGLESTLLSLFEALQLALGSTKGIMQAGVLPSLVPTVPFAR